MIQPITLFQRRRSLWIAVATTLALAGCGSDNGPGNSVLTTPYLAADISSVSAPGTTVATQAGAAPAGGTGNVPTITASTLSVAAGSSIEIGLDATSPVKEIWVGIQGYPGAYTLIPSGTPGTHYDLSIGVPTTATAGSFVLIIVTQNMSSVYSIPAQVAVNVAGTGFSPGLPNGTATQAQVLRGRYMVIAADCAGCHSPAGASPASPYWLSGYMMDAQLNPTNQGTFKIGPYTTYAANLTPDSATGLGSWSAQDIFNALRTGKDKSGMYLSPPMPWPNFRNMTDDDLWSIAAYLQSIKPVSNMVTMATGPGVPVGGMPDWTSFYATLQPLPPYPAGNEIPVAQTRRR